MKLSITPDKTWPKADERRSLRIAVYGSHFVSCLLAGALRDKGSVAFAELGSARHYLALDLETRFRSREFRDYSDILENNESVRLINNLEEGINWAVRRPDTARPSGTDLYRLAFGLCGDFVVLDLSGADEEAALKLAPDADGAVIVFDPLPSLLLSEHRLTDRLRLAVPKAICVVSRMNAGVHKGALRRFLGNADYIGLPYIDPVFIYKAEYSASLPWNVPQIRTAAFPAISELLERLGIR